MNRTFHVHKGTEAEIRRLGHYTWTQHVVSRDLAFHAYRSIGNCFLVFDLAGWQLKVNPYLVTIST